MRIRRNLNNVESSGEHLKTRQRQMILELIQQAGGHIDAGELYRQVVEKGIPVSRATMYRSLNLFNKLGLIDQKRFGKPQCYYELKHSPEHQHLVCSQCGKVIEFTCPLSEMLEKVKAENGFTVTRAEVYLEGLCSECEDKTGKLNSKTASVIKRSGIPVKSD
jgi:Fur family transcriptional regulator, ferric uptake regulator